ncbi:MAG TPA: hypothetical protein VF698_07700 [Thermoanaerobaculia bacterium]
MKRLLWVLVCLVLSTGSVVASTPDSATPAEESVCSGETGAAYGLCVAACEAKDCGDPNQKAAERACEANARQFERLTGRPLPCQVACPCAELVQLVADINSGAVQVQQCIAGSSVLSVITDDGNFVVINDGTPAVCSANSEPPFTELTPVQTLVCRNALRKAVEAAGVTCRPPE